MLKAIIIKSFIIALSVYVLTVLYMFMAQRSYVYFPFEQDFDSCKGFADAEKIEHNGTRFYYKNNSDKLIVYYHGNAGSACDRDYIKDEFEKDGYSYIFVEYAGYSNDTKKPSKDLLMLDARNVNDFLKTIEYSELALAGESIGASLTLYHSSLASEDKVLLLSPYYSAARIGQIHYPVFPIKLLMKDDYDNSEWINDLNKITIIHGTADDIVPMRESKKLYDEISIDDKKFIEIKGAGHNTLFSFTETFIAISDFLKK